MQKLLKKSSMSEKTNNDRSCPFYTLPIIGCMILIRLVNIVPTKRKYYLDIEEE